MEDFGVVVYIGELDVEVRCDVGGVGLVEFHDHF